jgi:hypothetical protein
MRFARRYPVIKGLLLLGPLLAATASQAGFDYFISRTVDRGAINQSIDQTLITRVHNFSWTASSGRSYLTWTTPLNQTTVKYTDYILNTTASNEGACYDVYTRPITSSALVTDTRIWTQTGPSTWQSVSDDVDYQTDRTSVARIWVGPSSGLTLRISPYDNGLNGIDFTLRTFHWQKGTTLATCQNTTKPFVNVNGGWPQVVHGT